jgi:hypothetical protein
MDQAAAAVTAMLVVSKTSPPANRIDFCWFLSLESLTINEKNMMATIKIGSAVKHIIYVGML